MKRLWALYCFVLLSVFVGLIGSSEEVHAVDLGLYLAYDNFTGTTGENLSIADRSLTNWVTAPAATSGNCTYSGEKGFCDASATNVEPMNRLQIYDATGASVTAVITFSMDVVSGLDDTGLRFALQQLGGTEFTRVTVNQSGDVNYFVGATPNKLMSLVADRNYTVYMTYNYESSCSYYIEETESTGVFAYANSAGCTGATTGSADNVEISLRATNGNALVDNLRVWNGTKGNDPELGNISFSSPEQLGYYTESENLTLSTVITELSNITFYILGNETEIQVCDQCNVTDFMLSPYLGFGRLNITAVIKDATENAIFNRSIEFFRGAVLETSCALPGASNVTLNFTTYDQYTNAYLDNITYAAQFVGWQDDIANNVTASISQSGDTSVNLQVCTVVNESVSMTSNYFVDYQKSNYDSRRYLQNGATLTPSTQNIALFLLGGDNSTAITFTLVDSRQQAVQSLTLEAYLFSVGDTYTLVETGVSDVSGQVRFNLDQNQEYRYLIKQGSTTLKTIDKFKPIQTTYTFQVDLNPDIVYRNVAALSNLTHLLYYNNNSMVVNVSWEAIPDLIDNACLEVMNKTTTSTESMNLTCVAADSGYIEINVSDFNGSYLLANFYVTAAFDGDNYTLSSLNIDMILTYLRFGLTGVFIFLFIGFTVFMGVAIDLPVLSIISVMVGLFLFFFTGIMGMSYVTLFSIIAVGGVLVFFMRNK